MSSIWVKIDIQMESKDQRCLHNLEPIEYWIAFVLLWRQNKNAIIYFLLFRNENITKNLCDSQYSNSNPMFDFRRAIIEISPSRPDCQFNSKLLSDIWMVIIKIFLRHQIGNIQSFFMTSEWWKFNIFAGVTTASHGPSPSTGDNNDNDHTPDFCQFSYTTVLSRPVKSSLKSAWIGQNRSNFCHHYAKKYTGLKIDGYERYQLR